MIDTTIEPPLKECKVCKQKSDVTFAFCSNCGGKFFMTDVKQNIKFDNSEPKLSTLLATASLYKTLPSKIERSTSSHEINTSHCVKNIQPISIKSRKVPNRIKGDKVHIQSNRQSPKITQQIPIINDNIDPLDVTKNNFLPDVISAIDKYYTYTDSKLEESILLNKKNPFLNRVEGNLHQISSSDYLNLNMKEQLDSPTRDIGDITHYLDDVGSVTDLYQRYVEQEKALKGLAASIDTSSKNDNLSYTNPFSSIYESMYDTIFNPERTNSVSTNPLNPPSMNSIHDIDDDKIQAVDKDESFRSVFWGSEEKNQTEKNIPETEDEKKHKMNIENSHIEHDSEVKDEKDYHCYSVISRLFKTSCDAILIALEESNISFKKSYTMKELYIKLTIITNVLVKGEKVNIEAKNQYEIFCEYSLKRLVEARLVVADYLQLAGKIYSASYEDTKTDNDTMKTDFIQNSNDYDIFDNKKDIYGADIKGSISNGSKISMSVSPSRLKMKEGALRAHKKSKAAGIQASKGIEDNQFQMLQKKELILSIQIKEEECTTVRVIQKWVPLHDQRMRSCRIMQTRIYSLLQNKAVSIIQHLVRKFLSKKINLLRLK